MSDSFVQNHTGEPYATSNGRIVSVIKNLRVGPRGGVSYVNAGGKAVYLKAAQVKQCMRTGLLPGDTAQVCRYLRRTHSSKGKRRYGGMHVDKK